MMAESNAPPTQVIIHPMAISYPKIFPSKAEKQDDGTLKYGAELWMYADNPRYAETYQQLMQAIGLATQDKWANQQVRFTHEAIKALSSKNDPPEKEGFFIRATSYSAPKVLRRGATPGTYVDVEDPEDAYPGVIVAAVVNASGYEYTDPKSKVTSRGVRFWLNQVLLLKDGPRLDSGSGGLPPEQTFGTVLNQLEFGTLTSGAASAVQGMPQMPGMPGMAPQQPQYPGMPQAPAGMPQMPGMPGEAPQQPQYPGMPQQGFIAPGGVPGFPQQPQYGVPGVPQGFPGQLPY